MSSMEIVPHKAADFQNGAAYFDGTLGTLTANRSDYSLIQLIKSLVW